MDFRFGKFAQEGNDSDLRSDLKEHELIQRLDESAGSEGQYQWDVSHIDDEEQSIIDRFKKRYTDADDGFPSLYQDMVGSVRTEFSAKTAELESKISGNQAMIRWLWILVILDALIGMVLGFVLKSIL